MKIVDSINSFERQVKNIDAKEISDKEFETLTSLGVC